MLLGRPGFWKYIDDCNRSNKKNSKVEESCTPEKLYIINIESKKELMFNCGRICKTVKATMQKDSLNKLSF